MSADIEAMKDANRNLSKKIDKLIEERDYLYQFKEKYEDLILQHHANLEQLAIKRSVTRVQVERRNKKGTFYILELTKVLDTSEGMYIEGIL